MVRGFARYAHGVDERHEVPPPGLLTGQFRRRTPYLYRDAEVAALIAAARALSGSTGLRPLTHATMLALLSVTGMRVSEVVNLDRDDVDLAGGVLSVRNSKFGKSRYLPMHASTTRALRRQLRSFAEACNGRNVLGTLVVRHNFSQSENFTDSRSEGAEMARLPLASQACVFSQGERESGRAGVLDSTERACEASGIRAPQSTPMPRSTRRK